MSWKQLAGKGKNFRLSSLILDITTLEPVPGVNVVLSRKYGENVWTFVDEKQTDVNGRSSDFLPDYGKDSSGIYKLTFQVDPYYKKLGQESFFPFVEVVFEV